MVPDLKLFWLLFSKNRPPKPTDTHRNVDIELNYRDNRRIKDGKKFKTRGMLLFPLGNLSHTSIPHYHCDSSGA